MASVPLVTHVNNILHPIISNVEVYVNYQQIYKSNGLYVYKSYNSNKNTKEFCTEEPPDEIIEMFLS